MHNPESVLKNDTHKVVCDSEIKTNHLISVKQLDQLIDNKKKKKKKIVYFAVPVDHRVKQKKK